MKIRKDLLGTASHETRSEFITQVSEEIEGRLTKKLYQEFSGTDSRILGVMSKHDDFFLTPQVRVQSRTVPGTSLNMNVEIREPIGDRSQNYLRPEADASV